MAIVETFFWVLDDKFVTLLNSLLNFGFKQIFEKFACMAYIS